MPEPSSLLKVGSIVKVNIFMVEDRIPESLSQLLIHNPEGTILGYKMVDGTGIGFHLKMNDGTLAWFFEHELDNESLSNKDFDVTLKTNKSKSIKRNSYFANPIRNDDNLITLFNPNYFIKWLLFSLKDVV